jgi:long-chain acyl-CoA synthetase
VGQYGCSVIFRELDSVALIDTIQHRHIIHAFVVPAVLQFMLMVPGIDDADLSRMRWHPNEAI